MMILRSPFRPGRRNAAFSLVEIALALGIVGFALVGIVGAIPLAMNNGRLSVAQTRAASLANTVFANFRSQSFGTAQYLDDPAPADAIDLNQMVTTKDAVNGGPIPQDDRVHDPVVFYAAFDEIPSAITGSDARRLHFLKTPPTAAMSYYKIVMRFNNQPLGTLAPYPASAADPTLLHAQANGIEASVSESDRPNDVFRFNSVIANRL